MSKSDANIIPAIFCFLQMCSLFSKCSVITVRMFRNVGKLVPKLAQLSSQQIVLKNNYYRVLTTKTIRNPLTVQSHFTQRRYKETDYSNFGNEPDKPTKYGIFYRLLLAIVPWVLFMSPVLVYINI